MDDPKYVVHEYSAYIFPRYENHREFCVKMGLDLNEVRGAGFVHIGKNGLSCYGKSISLDIPSRPEDTEIVNKLFTQGF